MAKADEGGDTTAAAALDEHERRAAAAAADAAQAAADAAAAAQAARDLYGPRTRTPAEQDQFVRDRGIGDNPRPSRLGNAAPPDATPIVLTPTPVPQQQISDTPPGAAEQNTTTVGDVLAPEAIRGRERMGSGGALLDTSAAVRDWLNQNGMPQEDAFGHTPPFGKVLINTADGPQYVRPSDLGVPDHAPVELFGPKGEIAGAPLEGLVKGQYDAWLKARGELTHRRGEQTTGERGSLAPVVSTFGRGVEGAVTAVGGRTAPVVSGAISGAASVAGGALAAVNDFAGKPWQSLLGRGLIATGMITGEIQPGDFERLVAARLAAKGVTKFDQWTFANEQGDIAGEVWRRASEQGPAFVGGLAEGANPVWWVSGALGVGVGKSLIGAGINPRVASLVESAIANGGLPYADKALNAVFLNGMTRSIARGLGDRLEQATGGADYILEALRAILPDGGPEFSLGGRYSGPEGVTLGARVDFGLLGKKYGATPVFQAKSVLGSMPDEVVNNLGNIANEPAIARVIKEWRADGDENHLAEIASLLRGDQISRSVTKKGKVTEEYLQSDWKTVGMFEPPTKLNTPAESRWAIQGMGPEVAAAFKAWEAAPGDPNLIADLRAKVAVARVKQPKPSISTPTTKYKVQVLAPDGVVTDQTEMTGGQIRKALEGLPDGATIVASDGTQIVGTFKKGALPVEQTATERAAQIAPATNRQSPAFIEAMSAKQTPSEYAAAQRLREAEMERLSNKELIAIRDDPKRSVDEQDAADTVLTLREPATPKIESRNVHGKVLWEVTAPDGTSLGSSQEKSSAKYLADQWVKAHPAAARDVVPSEVSPSPAARVETGTTPEIVTLPDGRFKVGNVILENHADAVAESARMTAMRAAPTLHADLRGFTDLRLREEWRSVAGAATRGPDVQARFDAVHDEMLRRGLNLRQQYEVSRAAKGWDVHGPNGEKHNFKSQSEADTFANTNSDALGVPKFDYPTEQAKARAEQAAAKASKGKKGSGGLPETLNAETLSQRIGAPETATQKANNAGLAADVAKREEMARLSKVFQTDAQKEAQLAKPRVGQPNAAQKAEAKAPLVTPPGRFVVKDGKVIDSVTGKQHNDLTSGTWPDALHRKDPARAAQARADWANKKVQAGTWEGRDNVSLKAGQKAVPAGAKVIEPSPPGRGAPTEPGVGAGGKQPPGKRPPAPPKEPPPAPEEGPNPVITRVVANADGTFSLGTVDLEAGVVIKRGSERFADNESALITAEARNAAEDAVTMVRNTMDDLARTLETQPQLALMSPGQAKLTNALIAADRKAVAKEAERAAADVAKARAEYRARLANDPGYGVANPGGVPPKAQPLGKTPIALEAGANKVGRAARDSLGTFQILGDMRKRDIPGAVGGVFQTTARLTGTALDAGGIARQMVITGVRDVVDNGGRAYAPAIKATFESYLRPEVVTERAHMAYNEALSLGGRELHFRTEAEMGGEALLSQRTTQVIESAPLAGGLIQRSQASFNNGINMASSLRFTSIVKNRIRQVDKWNAAHPDQLRSQMSPEELDRLAWSINHSFGYGYNAKDITNTALKTIHNLATTLYAPQWQASRVGVIVDFARAFPKVMTGRGDVADSEAFWNGITFIAANVGTVVGIGAALGVDIEWDPRGTNFARLPLGQSRPELLPYTTALSALGVGVQTYSDGTVWADFSAGIGPDIRLLSQLFPISEEGIGTAKVKTGSGREYDPYSAPTSDPFARNVQTVVLDWLTSRGAPGTQLTESIIAPHFGDDPNVGRRVATAALRAYTPMIFADALESSGISRDWSMERFMDDISSGHHWFSTPPSPSPRPTVRPRASVTPAAPGAGSSFDPRAYR